MSKLNTVAAIIRDDVALISAKFGDEGRIYKYLAPLSLAETLESGDLVAVESNSRKVGYAITAVHDWEPNANLDPEDGIDYLWAFQKIDLGLLNTQQRIQNAIVDKLENRRQLSVRQQALAALGITDPKLFLENIKAQ